ncbi:cytochrome c [Sulfitobacter faviae]|uniref:Cytochrome c n=1 Tax=Sulfitobacter faviae TaxID=1775881 RepID=A0ABZ0UWI3_9RHOB|nr:cytochrome c [Sulfitobacter faviae]WPZ20474.1 cytochrome c [Sulfitobacter faviae]
MRPHLAALAGLSCALLSACSEGSSDDTDRVRAGQRVYAKECAACHGAQGEGGGPMSLHLDVVPPDLAGLKQRNDGYFPREFVSRFVVGQLAKDDPASPMPDFSAVGLRHVYPNGGADGEVLETDFANLLDYLEAIQW